MGKSTINGHVQCRKLLGITRGCPKWTNGTQLVLLPSRCIEVGLPRSFAAVSHLFVLSIGVHAQPEARPRGGATRHGQS